MKAVDDYTIREDDSRIVEDDCRIEDVCRTVEDDWGCVADGKWRMEAAEVRERYRKNGWSSQGVLQQTTNNSKLSHTNTHTSMHTCMHAHTDAQACMHTHRLKIKRSFDIFYQTTPNYWIILKKCQISRCDKMRKPNKQILDQVKKLQQWAAEHDSRDQWHQNKIKAKASTSEVDDVINLLIKVELKPNDEAT